MHSLVGVQVITNAADIPEIGDFMDYSSVTTYDVAGEQIVWHYPEFIQQDGEFVDGVHMILLDVEITSENAENWTVYDLNENGDPKGLYSDPYVFRIDGMYWLREKEALPGLNPRGWFPMFFSGYNTTDEHVFAYRILPGEKQSYTLGYLVGTKRNCDPWKLNEIWIRFPYGIPGSKNHKESLIELEVLN